MTVAQRVEITLVCDEKDCEHPEDDVQTISFALDGADLEAELCDTRAAALRDFMEPFVVNARPVSRTTARRQQQLGKKKRPGTDRERSDTIRAWAKDQGYKVNERGRIPMQIVAEYDEANPF